MIPPVVNVTKLFFIRHSDEEAKYAKVFVPGKGSPVSLAKIIGQKGLPQINTPAYLISLSVMKKV